MRSASPSLMVRNTTPESRYRPLTGHRCYDPRPFLSRHRTLSVRWRDKNELHRAEAPVAVLEVGDGVEEVLAAEVGPEHVGEVQLRVRHLPQQIVRDAGLPRRA